jgi:hypothetical protein
MLGAGASAFALFLGSPNGVVLNFPPGLFAQHLTPRGHLQCGRFGYNKSFSAVDDIEPYLPNIVAPSIQARRGFVLDFQLTFYEPTGSVWKPSSSSLIAACLVQVAHQQPRRGQGHQDKYHEDSLRY